MWRLTSHRANYIEPRKILPGAFRTDSHRGLIRID
jgi:hypothetical protein